MPHPWAGPSLGAILGLALLAPRDAAAQASTLAEPVEAEPVEAVIEIEQAPGSEACPNKEAVFRSIEHLFPERKFRQGSPDSATTARARVTIRPLAPGHEAVLTLLPPRHGERVIHEEDENCRGLADALALAFVMLIAPPKPSAEKAGGEGAPTTPPAVEKPSPPATATTKAAGPVPERTTETRPAKRSYRAGFGASLVGGLGVLSEPSLGVGAEAELFHELGFGLSLQGIRLWSLPAEAEGGSVTLSVWGLLIAPCYRHRVGTAASLDACLRLGIGSQHADVKGFEAAQSGNFPWRVLVPSVSYRRALPGLSGLSGFVRLGFVGQLSPQSFSVRRTDGSGDTLQIASAPAFGVMTDIGLVFGTGLF